MASAAGALHAAGEELRPPWFMSWGRKVVGFEHVTGCELRCSVDGGECLGGIGHYQEPSSCEPQGVVRPRHCDGHVWSFRREWVVTLGHGSFRVVIRRPNPSMPLVMSGESIGHEAPATPGSEGPIPDNGRG